LGLINSPAIGPELLDYNLFGCDATVSRRDVLAEARLVVRTAKPSQLITATKSGQGRPRLPVMFDK
jgi:hypothetical protein